MTNRDKKYLSEIYHLWICQQVKNLLTTTVYAFHTAQYAIYNIQNFTLSKMPTGIALALCANKPVHAMVYKLNRKLHNRQGGMEWIQNTHTLPNMKTDYGTAHDDQLLSFNGRCVMLSVL